MRVPDLEFEHGPRHQGMGTGPVHLRGRVFSVNYQAQISIQGVPCPSEWDNQNE